MDINSLKAFLAVADAGSFSSAAEQLHLTQSAISKRIQLLEQQLKVSLFERHNRTISLTEAGSLLIPRAENILALVSDTEQEVENTSGKIQGRLSIATSHHIGLHRLPPILKRFVQQYPDVKMDIKFMGSENAYQAIQARQIELALTTLDSHLDQAITTTEIWQDKMLCICSETHPLANIRTPSFKELSEHYAILPEENTITYQLIHRAFAERQLPLNTHMPTNYLETIKMMVSVGLGWSLLPESMIDSPAIKKLEWPDKQAQPNRKLGAIQLKDRSLSNAALAFLDYLRLEQAQP